MNSSATAFPRPESPCFADCLGNALTNLARQIPRSSVQAHPPTTSSIRVAPGRPRPVPKSLP
ncbi:hypothetical protein C7212DRAFT_312359, partial [Tuber magnatum]